MMSAQVEHLKRYELFGWDYAERNLPPKEAVRWYLDHAAATGGPILELACGTGSLLVEFAAAGYEVTGLDLSGGMLALARERVEKLSAENSERVTLLQENMADFQLGRRFPLIVLADNSFRELGTHRELQACLACIRRHLEPDGVLLLTERRFLPASYPGGEQEWPWSEPLTDPSSGAAVRRRISIRVDPEAMRLEGVMIYQSVFPDGVEETENLPFTSLLLHPEDYLPLFESAGLSVRLFVGYEKREDDGEERMLCFVARRAEAGRF
jgi:SAM-dependent methyltransferase